VAALATKKLLIGVTQQFMLVKKKHGEFLQPFDVRCKVVQEYLKDFSGGLEIELYPLADGYGPYNRSTSVSPRLRHYHRLGGNICRRYEVK
jgi:phosphopantetheine adenylyltransferase